MRIFKAVDNEKGKISQPRLRQNMPFQDQKILGGPCGRGRLKSFPMTSCGC